MAAAPSRRVQQRDMEVWILLEASAVHLGVARGEQIGAAAPHGRASSVQLLASAISLFSVHFWLPCSSHDVLCRLSFWLFITLFCLILCTVYRLLAGHVWQQVRWSCIATLTHRRSFHLKYFFIIMLASFRIFVQCSDRQRFPLRCLVGACRCSAITGSIVAVISPLSL